MDVLISGASIAGPAVAHWLHRYGLRATIVERAPAIRPGGQAVDLRGVARTVVERMGLMPAITKARLDERGFANVNAAGRHVARMPADMFGGEGIVAEIEILKGDLTRILYEATRDDVEYLFGDRITGLSQDGTGVDVTFASGPARRFDYVIGADGFHSGVRALAFGPPSRFVRHLGAYNAFFTVRDPGDLDRWFELYSAPGRRSAGIRPEPGGRAKALLSFASPPLDYDRADTAWQMRLLASRFEGAGWRTPDLLEQMWHADDFYFDAIGQVHMPRWTSGRVALVGDSAYCASPLAGLGTSLAVVGAYVLAGELAAGTPEAYDERMRPYVKQCQELPPGGVRGLLPKRAWAIRMRNHSMRLMGVWPWKALLEKQFGKADAIELPDYSLVA
jgi:2-polyprenyl-6-methoxyphenol hydroxylase-like FAD-dependent oxidoreductase